MCVYGLSYSVSLLLISACGRVVFSSDQLLSIIRANAKLARLLKVSH